MANPLKHAKSSVKIWRGKVDDYLAYIHNERELWYEVFVRDDPITKPEEFKKQKS